ncbi:protein-tyrosine phosphatase [Nonlabens sp. Hel1_33_55]|uniref:tyrosine-protein phosphatase n=1 Tax=Nonlabens sp. Hel1_33_55 TaxID=1336802 RepID=UPI000875E782|nr:CpsB/CapC family capsule biosynthesis tyrosine phosphatase [Nonlabens sp. Hel1_33_55]SCX94830.1 protein-tyrosine phosphatase [Nonlabens sp. Hel1_33_55]
MFFFTKKIFLADAIDSIVDVHNHLLPNIDDGSDSLETTSQMIKLYRELGFSGVYTTPHTMEDYYGNDADKIKNSFTQTKADLSENEASFLLGTASEYMMDGGFEELLKTENFLTLPNKQLLFEFSYFQKPVNAEELIFEMNNLEIHPILAHPERYRYLDVKKILDFKNRGCALQLNVLSLSGHYGSDAKQKSLALLKDNQYEILATDAHKPEHLEKVKQIQMDKKIMPALQHLVEVQMAKFN